MLPPPTLTLTPLSVYVLKAGAPVPAVICLAEHCGLMNAGPGKLDTLIELGREQVKILKDLQSALYAFLEEASEDDISEPVSAKTADGSDVSDEEEDVSAPLQKMEIRETDSGDEKGSAGVEVRRVKHRDPGRSDIRWSFHSRPGVVSEPKRGSDKPATIGTSSLDS